MGRRAWIGGMAAGGVLATHLLTFALLAPDAHARADLLARSGHGSFTLVAAVGIGLAAAATAHFCIAAAGRGAVRPAVARTAARLAAAQAAGWIALETAERLAHSGAHWEPRAFAVGLVVQAVVALAGALLLRALHRGIQRLTERLRRRWPRRPAPARLWRAGRVPALRPALLVGASGLRGPPARS